MCVCVCVCVDTQQSEKKTERDSHVFFVGSKNAVRVHIVYYLLHVSLTPSLLPPLSPPLLFLLFFIFFLSILFFLCFLSLSSLLINLPTCLPPSTSSSSLIQGKTTMLLQFLEREETAKPTTAMEYTFGRRSHGANIVRTSTDDVVRSSHTYTCSHV